MCVEETNLHSHHESWSKPLPENVDLESFLYFPHLSKKPRVISLSSGIKRQKKKHSSPSADLREIWVNVFIRLNLFVRVALQCCLDVPRSEILFQPG